jgi:thiol-disulfide isomerase/thioredoxin
VRTAGLLTKSLGLGSAVLAFAALTSPAAELIPLNGDSYARMLRSQRGKVVLVDFWATWCEPCREELPKLVALSRKVDSRKFQLITVSADEPELESAVVKALDREGVRGPRYIKRVDDDQAFIDSIDKKWSGALPALFLYDASGHRVAGFIGESDAAEVEAAVRKAIQRH